MDGVTARESRIEQERRAWVERQERFKDLGEEYERRLAAAPSAEVRRHLQQGFSEKAEGASAGRRT